MMTFPRDNEAERDLRRGRLYAPIHLPILTLFFLL